MTYSKDLRMKVIRFLDQGGSMREAQRAFNISLATVNRWRQKFRRTGGVAVAPRRSGFRKLDPDKLRAYVGAHPDAYLTEIGDAFGCSGPAVMKAFRRLGITRGKKPRNSGSRGRSR